MRNSQQTDELINGIRNLLIQLNEMRETAEKEQDEFGVKSQSLEFERAVHDLNARVENVLRLRAEERSKLRASSNRV